MRTPTRIIISVVIYSLALFGLNSVAALAGDTQYCQGNVCSDTPPPPDSNGGFAVVHPDGHVCGVIVGSIAYFGGNDKTMESEYMGCPIGSRIIFQTKADPVTGNVAGYHGSSPGTSVTYDNSTNSFSVSTSSTPEQSNSNSSVTNTVTLIIKDGIATDSSGRSFNTGSGATTTTSLSQEQYQQLVTESNRIDSAKNQRLTALSQAQLLASQTPGVERCVSWSGYLENGQECAIATATNDTVTVQSRSVSNSLVSSDSKTVLNIDSSTGTSTSDSLTVTVKATNEFIIPVLKSESVEVKGAIRELSSLVQKIETNQKLAAEIDKSLKKLESIKKVSASAMVKLPDARSTSETAISLTPNVCTVDGIQVSRVSKGTCTVSYTITSDAGNSYTTEKSFNFR